MVGRKYTDKQSDKLSIDHPNVVQVY